MKPLLCSNLVRGSLAITACLTIAACAGRSLDRPEVVDWSSSARPAVTSPAPTGGSTSYYSVSRGDTLASIGARFHASPSDLAAWNNLGPGQRLAENQVLRLSPPDATRPSDANPVATTMPIGGETIEQRPIGTPANAQPNAQPNAGPAVSSSAPLKSAPLGLKRPYSDAALAELSRPDVDGGTPVATQPPSPASPPSAAAAASATSLNWSWPTSGRVAGGFDDKSKGIDLAGKAGDPVLAAADGKVTFAGTGVRGYGNFVIVQHSPDLLSVYAHNRMNLVKEGALVTRGQKIAEMGDSDADAVKLHFEIRRDSKPVDPLQYLPSR